MNAHRTRLGAMIFAAGVCMSSTAILVGAAPAYAHADVAVIGDVNGTSLYLQSGTVDTSVARLDLGAFIERQLAKGGPGLAGRHFVLQLTGPMRPEWRERLRGAGIEAGDYVPMNAFIVTLDRADAKRAAGLEFVRWFDEYRPEWKLAPELAAAGAAREWSTPERQQLAQAGAKLVVITLFCSQGADAALRHIAAIAGAQAHWVQPIGDNMCIAATMPTAQVAGLANLPSVQFVEDAPELTLRNDSNRWIVQSNVMNSTPLYDQGLHGEDQVVGILDTRVDRNHCSFSDTDPIGPAHRKILAYNSSFGSEFHGTHVAGTVVGDNNDNTATRGIAYLGKLVFNTMPPFNETEMVARLNTHHSQGARMHTNSWGDDGTTQYNSLCRGIDVFSYNNEDDLILFAVTNLGSLKNPENAKNLLAVGASEDAPSQAQHCSGGAGPTSDQRRKPEIYAPGCDTRSASAGTSCGTTQATGTSMACPAVAAVGMLVRQYYQEGFYPSGARSTSDAFTPTGALVKATLLNSAVDMTGVTGYPSNSEGWGRVLADSALHFEGEVRRSLVTDVRNADGLSTGEVIEMPVNVLSAAEGLKVTLVWTEPAASSGASFASINDLDLELVAPGNIVYRGNVFSGGQSATGGSRDDRNNVEQVHLNTPAAGAYTLRIRATGVNQGLQGYALVVSGDIITPAAGISVAIDFDLPTAIAPHEPFPISVSIDAGADTLIVGSPLLNYRFDSAAEFQSVPLTFLEGQTYTGILPAASCGDTPQLYISAEGAKTGVRTDPPAGATAPFAVAVGTALVAFTDDMQTDQGWAVSGTATSGVWMRAAPVSGLGVPPADHSEPGTACYITGQESPFGGANRNDVDGGRTVLTSPRFDLSGDSSAVVSYWRWFNNTGGTSPQEDTFVVEASNDDGETWVVVEEVGPAGAGTTGGWEYHQASIESVVSLTSEVRVRFIAQDLAGDSNIEAAIDDVRLDVVECEGVECACDWNGSGVLNSQDFFDFVSDFFGGSADFNQNGVTNSQDFFDYVGCFFNGCP